MEKFVDLTIGKENTDLPAEFKYKGKGYVNHEVSAHFYSIPHLDGQFPYFLIYACINLYQIEHPEFNGELQKFPFMNLILSLLDSKDFFAKWDSTDPRLKKRVITKAVNRFDSSSVRKSRCELDVLDTEFNISQILRDNSFVNPSETTKTQHNSLPNNFQLMINWNYARPSLSTGQKSFMYLDQLNIENDPTGKSTFEYLNEECKFKVYKHNVKTQDIRDMAPNTYLTHSAVSYAQTANNKFITNDYNNPIDKEVTIAQYTWGCVDKWFFNMDQKQSYINRHPCYPWSPIVNKLYLAKKYQIYGAWEYSTNGLEIYGDSRRIYQAVYTQNGTSSEEKLSNKFYDQSEVEVNNVVPATDNAQINSTTSPKMKKTIRKIFSHEDTFVCLSEDFGKDNDPGQGHLSCGNFGFTVGGWEGTYSCWNGPTNLYTSPGPNGMKYDYTTEKLDLAMLKYLDNAKHLNLKPNIKGKSSDLYELALQQFNYQRFIIYKTLIVKQISLCIQSIVEGKPDIESKRLFKSIFIINGPTESYLKDYTLYSGLIAGFLDIGSAKSPDYIKGFGRCIAKNDRNYNPFLEYLWYADDVSRLMKDVLHVNDGVSNIFVDTISERNKFTNYVYQSVSDNVINEDTRSDEMFIDNSFSNTDKKVVCDNPFESKIDLREISKFLCYSKQQSPIEILSQKIDAVSEFFTYKNYRTERDFFCRTLNYHPSFTQSTDSDIIPFFGLSRPVAPEQSIGFIIDEAGKQNYYQFGVIDEASVNNMINQLDGLFLLFKQEVLELNKLGIFRYYSDIIKHFGNLYYKNAKGQELAISSNPIMNTYITGTYIMNRLEENTKAVFGNIEFIPSKIFYNIVHKRDAKNSLEEWCNDVNNAYRINSCTVVRLPSTFQSCLNIAGKVGNYRLSVQNIVVDTNADKGSNLFVGKYKFTDASIPENCIIMGDNFIPLNIKKANSRSLTFSQCTELNFIPISTPSFTTERVKYEVLTDETFDNLIQWKILKESDHYLKYTCPYLFNTPQKPLVSFIAKLSLNGSKFACIDLSRLEMKDKEFEYKIEYDKRGGIVLKFYVDLPKTITQYNFEIRNNMI